MRVWQRGERTLANTSSDTRLFPRPFHGTGFVLLALGAVVVILGMAAFFLIYNLPDADAFNTRVERLFVENKDLTSEAELRLLEILAHSGSAFSDTLASYRAMVLVLFVFAAALLIAAAVFLINTVASRPQDFRGRESGNACEKPGSEARRTGRASERTGS